MKATAKFLSSLYLLSVLFSPSAVSAADTGAYLSGPDTVPAGDSITLTFSLSGSGIYGASGTLSYDSSQLTLTGTHQTIGGEWEVEFSGNSFLAYDNALTDPIQGSAELFAVTFQVSGSLEPGTAVSISCTGVTASDGASDANIGTVSYSATVAQEEVSIDPTKAGTDPMETEPATADPTDPETQLTQTVPDSTAPTEPAMQEPADSTGAPLWTYILLALACLAVGVGAGIVIGQKYFNKK